MSRIEGMISLFINDEPRHSALNGRAAALVGIAAVQIRIEEIYALLPSR